MSNQSELAQLASVFAGSALSNRNLLINSAMQVAQRGTSSTASGYGSIDRWLNTFSGVSLTQSQQSLTSGEPFEAGFRNYLRLTQSSSSSAASDYAQISQRIEGLNAATSGWHYKSSTSYITASFWVRSSLAGTYYVYMQTRSDSGDGYINAPFTISANTWTKVVVSFAGNSSLNIDNDNTSGIEFRIIPYYGTNYTSSSLPSNAWYFSVSGGELPDFDQNWCASSGATFDLTGVQLEVGDTATPFEHRLYGDELARCQRYYQVIKAASGSEYRRFARGHVVSSTILDCSTNLFVEMRTFPTLATTGTPSNYAIYHGNTVTACSTTPNLNPASDDGVGNLVSLNGFVASGLTLGQGAALLSNNSTSAYLAFDAEL